MLPWAEAPWRAWNELSGERQFVSIGYAVPMGAMMIVARPCPIPWSALQAWCDRAMCGREEREVFVVPIVMALDREFISHWERQQSSGRTVPADEKLRRWEEASG